MHSVWKYKLDPITELKMPKGAEVLTINTQGTDIFLWAKVDPEADDEVRLFRGFATGDGIPDKLNLNYIATVFPGRLVFHVFEDLTE